jgi:hypothetical protein
MKHQPTGTNLFDATQATAMVEYIAETEIEALQAELASERAKVAELEGKLAIARGFNLATDAVLKAERALSDRLAEVLKAATVYNPFMFQKDISAARAALSAHTQARELTENKT